MIEHETIFPASFIYKLTLANMIPNSNVDLLLDWMTRSDRDDSIHIQYNINKPNVPNQNKTSVSRLSHRLFEHIYMHVRCRARKRWFHQRHQGKYSVEMTPFFAVMDGFGSWNRAVSSVMMKIETNYVNKILKFLSVI